MDCIKLVILTFTLLFLGSATAAEIKVSGAIRNDAIFMFSGQDSEFNNLLENQLVLQRRAADWKFYSDLRFYLLYGNAADSEANSPEADYSFVPRILRTFIRYYTDYGDFTLGKTYIPFGNAGVFNPFELDRGINFMDLNYIKEGILALSWELPLGGLGGIKAYFSPEALDSDLAAGITVYTNISSYDLGTVINRSGRDMNIIGGYFKGDLEIGVQGSYAFHFDDHGGNTFSEAKAGIDYSFLEGKLLASALGYYNGRTDENAGSDQILNFNAASSSPMFFTDKYYMYFNLAYMPDEFFNFRLDAFLNAVDASSLLIPSATWVLGDGLSAGLQGFVPTGAGRAEFSRDTLGDYGIIIKVEAKL
jgi:hypothetical protein